MGKYLFGFTIGIITGALISSNYFKHKYEQIAQAEIDSVKEVFSKKNKSSEQETKNEVVATDIEDQIDDEVNEIDAYESKLKECGYVDYSKRKQNNKTSKKVDKPYVIHPDEFGELDDYETISLTYYEDHVLTDDLDEPIEDVEAVVGPDALETFGNYDDDAVYVRNDARKCDYEILASGLTYEEVVKNRMHY